MANSDASPSLSRRVSGISFCQMVHPHNEIADIIKISPKKEVENV